MHKNLNRAGFNGGVRVNTKGNGAWLTGCGVGEEWVGTDGGRDCGQRGHLHGDAIKAIPEHCIEERDVHVRASGSPAINLALARVWMGGRGRWRCAYQDRAWV